MLLQSVPLLDNRSLFAGACFLAVTAFARLSSAQVIYEVGDAPPRLVVQPFEGGTPSDAIQARSRLEKLEAAIWPGLQHHALEEVGP